MKLNIINKIEVIIKYYILEESIIEIVIAHCSIKLLLSLNLLKILNFCYISILNNIYIYMKLSGD